jgi:AcrR family transcriptional regulator
MSDPIRTRMTADDRRESILEAATTVFGERGYVGATTDQIAQAAGISQAYVVRMFGSKERLFIEAGQRAATRVAARFREAISELTGAETPPHKEAHLAQAYASLIADRGTLLTLMHFCTLGGDEAFGPLSREAYLRIYRIIRDEAGLGVQGARDFLARGMLVNTLLAMHMPSLAEDDSDAHELLSCTFDGHAEDVIALEERFFLPEVARRG